VALATAAAPTFFEPVDVRSVGPFTLIQPINNNSGLTAILAFVVVLLLLLFGWRFVVSGRDAPGPA
jgi:hypothetical protein